MQMMNNNNLPKIKREDDEIKIKIADNTNKNEK